MNFAKSKALQAKFHSIVPGGSHTYAKGDDQYPERMPVYLARGKGSHVWDIDGNEFIEYGMGMRSVTLGHAHDSVVEAAYRQMRLGNNFVRPCPIELECAETLQAFIPAGEMVKFAKHGSDATSAAIKLARAFAGRDLVAVCADHPFFSVDDWFIGSTPMSGGIPKAVQQLTLRFRYNDLNSLRKLFADYPARIAAVILEVEREDAPAPGFLASLKELCAKEGAVLIFDETITGFRWHNGGAQHFHSVTPDLSTFGKALGNGFSVSALVGRRDIMKLGGLDHDRERVFLLSTTHGAEHHALAAAIETMRIYRDEPVVETLWRQGRLLAEGITRVVRELGMEDYFKLRGQPCCLSYATLDQERKPSQEFRTLFLQETMRHGLLMPSLVISYSHSAEDVQRTIDGITAALRIYARALEQGIDRFLEGSPVKPVFRKFN
ncbi:MAG TPA: glutamate-1-semialdehyde 2,1-aminomutase [Candidatus Acidoferrum sp.]|jgi:glutamate-1-semialdehyde 2,1-aminomutase|nr:glutamate-1-semialdehyde 2,1-aminomutase [Candidatus Acidoferrum sp.]